MNEIEKRKSQLKKQYENEKILKLVAAIFIDIFGVLSTHEMFGESDLYAGQGGAPEGVLSAVAIKNLGGFMEGRIVKEGSKILKINDMVKNHGVFVATGVTGKGFLSRVEELGGKKYFTESVIISKDGVQFVENYEV